MDIFYMRIYIIIVHFPYVIYLHIILGYDISSYYTWVRYIFILYLGTIYHHIILGYDISSYYTWVRYIFILYLGTIYHHIILGYDISSYYTLNIIPPISLLKSQITRLFFLGGGGTSEWYQSIGLTILHHICLPQKNPLASSGHPQKYYILYIIYYILLLLIYLFAVGFNMSRCNISVKQNFKKFHLTK